MGDWTLVISGTGVHHNNSEEDCAAGLEEDADQRLLEFVDQLCRDGHTIRHAAILHGEGADTVALAYEGNLLVPLKYIRADGRRENAQARLRVRRRRRQSAVAPEQSEVPHAAAE